MNDFSPTHDILSSERSLLFNLAKARLQQTTIRILITTGDTLPKTALIRDSLEKEEFNIILNFAVEDTIHLYWKSHHTKEADNNHL